MTRFTKRKYMECGTTRPGRECPFMSLNGCELPGGCSVILKLCEGCLRVEEWPNGVYCAATPQPIRKWGGGKVCNLATHIDKEKQVKVKKTNPLKASKRNE